MNKIVILTGAGISAESGIKTFRDSGGLWEDHHIEDVATPEGFVRNPSLVHNFYNQRRSQLLSDEVSPNSAHFALAKLQNEFDGEVILITQNIDDLHERAGSAEVLHMHGELLKMRCTNSSQVFPLRNDLNRSMTCSCCEISGSLRPHIVWFGEMPFHMPIIEKHLSNCDLFISIGTSGLVYPAAMFVQIAKVYANAKTFQVNLETTDQSPLFDESRQGRASELVPHLVDEILGFF